MWVRGPGRPIVRRSRQITTSILLLLCTVHPSAQPPDPALSLESTTLTIPQVDYEPAIFHRDGDPYPHLDLEKVDRQHIVFKEHPAVVLENRYIRLTLLPAMGRVYSLIYKPTDHEQLWRNDIVTVGGGANDTGWWIWIGGIEYTLPGDEHGTTWSTPWTWEVLEDTASRKTVRMRVRELGTGLEETIDISVVPEKAYFEATIRIGNPTDRSVHYAHWVNPQWAPGGDNQLTDRTEFIIPTDRILIEDRWQQNLGPSPQDWGGNPLRFIGGWGAMGDLMADGLRHGFYSAYSHDAEEGIVRVFDKDKTPGVDIWTYGYHPALIPMGSGAANKGYAEMWGGTSKMYPDERKRLAPGDSIEWTEWMYPYQGTRGLTFADADLAVTLRTNASAGEAIVAICPSGPWRGVVELSQRPTPSAGDGEPLRRWEVTADPTSPFFAQMGFPDLDESGLAGLRLRVGSDRDGWIVVAAEPGSPGSVRDER